MPPAVEAQSPNHWTAREFLGFGFYFTFSLTKCIPTLQTLRTQGGDAYFYKLRQHRRRGKSTLLKPNAIVSLDSFKESTLYPTRGVSF